MMKYDLGSSLVCECENYYVYSVLPNIWFALFRPSNLIDWSVEGLFTRPETTITCEEFSQDMREHFVDVFGNVFD